VTPPVPLPAAIAPGLTATAPLATAAPSASQAPVTIVAPPAADRLVRERPVDTAGLEQESHSARDQGRLRQARSVEARTVGTTGETPDDFVWVPERRLRATAATPRVPAPRFPAGAGETPDDFVFVPPATAAWPRQSPVLPGVAAAVTRP
jgi:hypothetical protein